jgi:alkylglycerol monooxygenase
LFPLALPCKPYLLSPGALPEKKKWKVKFEYAPLVLGILIVLLLDFPAGHQVLFSGLNFCPVIWFYNLQKRM